MREQDVCVSFPNLKVCRQDKDDVDQSINKITFSVSKITDIKYLASKYISTFIEATQNEVFKPFGGGNCVCHIPALYILKGDDTILDISAFEVVHSSVLPAYVNTLLNSIIESSKFLVTGTLKGELQKPDCITVNFLQDRISITCSMDIDLGEEKYELLVTEEMVKAAKGDLDIYYTDKIHTALWRLLHNLAGHLTPSIVATLYKLEFTSDTEKVTDLGKQVLKEFDEIKPTEYPQLYNKIVDTLFNNTKVDNPTAAYLANNGFWEPGGVSSTGKKWLEENHYTLWKKCKPKLRKKLIPYLSLGMLAPLLASDDPIVRNLAKQRFDELEGLNT